MVARYLTAAVGLALCACATPQEADPTRPSTTGQALAQAACPHRIAEASAWIDYMPGGNRGPRQLNVAVRFADPADTALILKSRATRPGDTLVLEIRTTQSAQIPGHVAYREPVPDPLYKRISVFCRGAEIFSINEIQRVY